MIFSYFKFNSNPCNKIAEYHLRGDTISKENSSKAFGHNNFCTRGPQSYGSMFSGRSAPKVLPSDDDRVFCLHRIHLHKTVWVKIIWEPNQCITAKLFVLFGF